MTTNQQKFMVDHLRDMFNGSFDDDVIESILIHRDWDVDRALDDLMAITSGCTFNIPIEDFDTNDPNQASEFSEFLNDGLGGACADSALPLAASPNFYPVEDEIPFIIPEEVNDDMKNESEDDVIVLNQEEYCLSPESESDEEPAAAESSSTAQTGTALSYAAAAKTVAPTTEPVARVKPPYMVYQGYTSYDQIKRTRDSLERVKLFVKDGFKIMVLLRGCPGSGKSTLAKKIIEECGVENNIYQHVHSTDNFFYLNKTGQYQMDIEKRPEAHRWNQVNVLHVAREGLTPLVIDNTNTRAWHMVAYAKIAVCAGYEIEVMEPDTPWAFKLQELVYRNQHDVPPKTLMNTLEGYEHNVSALSLLRGSNLEYAADRRPPQLGVRRLTEPNLIQVFENIRNALHCVAECAAAKAAAMTAAKKLTKAEKKRAKAEKKQAKAEKKQRKHEKRLKKMIEEARHEATESEAGDEDSNDSCIRDGDAETIKAFVSTDLREKGADDDGTSENSWTTIDTHDDYDDNNSSDDERESVADDDEKDSSSSSSYEEPTLVRENTRSDSAKTAQKSSGSKMGPKVRLNFQNVNSVIADLKDADKKERTLDAESDNKPEFRSQLYDALAKNGPRLTFFMNMRTEDESSSERSKDSTMENISRKLDELDNMEGQQLSQDLETPEELLIDSNAMSASTPAAIEEEILRYVDECDPTATADQVDCSSDSKNGDEESQPNDESTVEDVHKCEWVGLENCVNLPSNVRIESSVGVVEFRPATEKNAESVTDLVKNQDQSLKIRDVIPSCLMNEVVESGADVSLDEQLLDTASTPTTKNWNSGCWLNDFQSHEQVESETFPSVVGNDVSNSSVSDIDPTDDLVLDVEVEKINLASNNKKELSKIILVNGEEPQSDSKEATNSQITIQIFDTVSNEIENSIDVTLDEVLGEANPDSEVVDEIPTCSFSDAEKIIDVTPASSLTDAEKIIEVAPMSLLTDAEKASVSSLTDAEKAVEVAPVIGPLTDAEKITEAAPAMETKRMSLTSAIKNWLSSNPLNEVKNNASPTSFDQLKGTSFTSAIKSWVSGSSQNETKSNTDVLDSPSTATNTTSSVAAFDTRCKLTNSPKNLIDDSPTKLKLESKSPIRGVKNKLCNVETEICNEADILQTVLRQERQKKKRNDNAANVDDMNLASKFNRNVEGGGTDGTNVVKNIFDGAYEDVNLFGEWNQVEKNQMEHSAVEGDSENSDCGSNSSSSDEIRTMADVHNSATRFVNNDINRDTGIERRKPDVNHELENRQLKNTNMTMSPPGAEIEPCWGIDSTPELNTLKERILINSFDKVFSHNNLELDAGAAASTDSAADVKPTKKSTLACGFQMIENKLRPETSGKEEAISKVENVANEDETEVSFWNQWIRGESWDEKPASSAEASSVDKMESKPPRNIRDSSPSSIPKVINSESNSCWLVNDIKSCIDLEKNHQKLPKNSNFLSSGDPFLQAKELREFVDDHRLPASAKLQNCSPNFDFLDERTDESKNLRRLSNEFSGMFLLGKRKRGDPYTEMTASSKWDCPGEVKSFNFSDPLIGGAPNMPPSQKQQLQTSPTMFAVSNSVKDRGVDESALRWKFDSLVDLDTSSNCWPKSIPKTFPTLEKEFSSDERKFESKQKTSELGNFFIPPEVLHLGQNKATNTGASDVGGYDRHLVGRCREINGRGGDAYEDDLSLIEARYNSDKSTMTEGNAYTVKAKPLREDLSNMFPHEMADAILDLYEKCNGNMDWIIEILMEDGYSPSDDQLEYLSSLQNVVEYRKPAGASPIKEKPPIDKKKSRSRNRNRKNEAKLLKNKRVGNVLLIPDILPDSIPTVVDDTPKPPVNSVRENEEENLLGTTTYEDTFDDSTECVDLFIDWTTVSQLIKYFGNPIVYPIQDYQPVIKLPVSLARHLHAHLIESVIDQAEKNENLMNQLNFELNAGPALEMNSHELTQIDLADVESSFPDYLVDEITNSQFEGENGIYHSQEAEPVTRSEDSFAATFSLNLLRKAFPTMDTSFVKDTFRSQNFNYFKTKSILSQYKDEVPVVNLTEVPPVGVDDAALDEANFKDNEIRLFDSSVINSSSRQEILAQVKQFREDAAANFSQWKRCHEKLKAALRDKRFGVASHCRETMEEFKRKYESCNAQAASLLVTSCCVQNDNIIDLHFFKVVEALRALDIFLDHHITKLASSGRQKAVLYVITGRGSRSIDGVSHLQPPIKQRLKQRDIEFCIESTNTGLVKAVIRKTSLLSQNL